jgi:hypothetical protein
MLPALPIPSLAPIPQLLCAQYFASNPFLFIDLAATPATWLNRFIDLREKRDFFQE